MRKTAAAFTSVLLLYFFSSCTVAEKENVAANDAAYIELRPAIPDTIVDKSIFIHETSDGFTRIWVDSKSRVGKYFYSDTLNIVNIGEYKFDNRTPKISKQIELYRNEWSYLQIDSASIRRETIDRQEYLFLTIVPEFMGKAIPDRMVLFYLLNLNNIEDRSSLAYAGYSDPYCDGCIKGRFAASEKPAKNKKAWQRFQQYAQKSKFISQLKNEEKKISYFKNYAQKWEEDNHTDNHYGAGFGIVPDPLYSTYYQESLFDYDGHSADERIENDYYIIATFFRGNLLGYDKKKKLYFPIIVESCAYACNKQLNFLADQTLEITYEDGETYEIKLDQIIFNK